MQRKYKYRLPQNWRRAKWTLALCCLYLGTLLAQQPYFLYPPINELLTGTQVRLAYEASNGFIWLGTEAGVYRYDGIDYQTYQLPDSSIEVVSSIFESADQRVWVGCQDGSIYHTTAGRQLSPWIRGQQINTEVRSIAQYRDQFIIATYGQGLFIVTADSTYQYTTEQGLYGNDIYDIHLSEKIARYC